jgi:hypothetical protein
MLHLQNGGTDEQFFNVIGDDYSDWELKDDDKETAKRILGLALKEAGLPDDMARRQILASEDEKKLIEDAKKFQERKKTQITKWKQDQEQEFNQKAEKQAAAIEVMTKAISTSLITDGRLDNIIIPEGDKKGFHEYVLKNVVVDGENFYMVNQLTPENIASALEAEYFRFKKGDLDELVKRKAKTQTTKKLRLDKKKAAESKKQPGEETKEKTFVSLGSL